MTGDTQLTFKLELFVTDLMRSIDFYQRVLGFEMAASHPDGYTPMSLGPVNIALNRLDGLPEDHPIQKTADERLGRGVELVLEVDDVNAVLQRIASLGWPLSGRLQQQPWGLTDFRIEDPDGYYWRISSRN